jgi:hypothetical protein
MEHSKLINELGGSKLLADAIGAAPNAVANWNKRKIPWRYRHVVAKLAAERGVDLPSDFWEGQAA